MFLTVDERNGTILKNASAVISASKDISSSFPIYNLLSPTHKTPWFTLSYFSGNTSYSLEILGTYVKSCPSQNPSVLTIPVRELRLHLMLQCRPLWNQYKGCIGSMSVWWWIHDNTKVLVVTMCDPNRLNKPRIHFQYRIRTVIFPNLCMHNG